MKFFVLVFCLLSASMVSISSLGQNKSTKPVKVADDSPMLVVVKTRSAWYPVAMEMIQGLDPLSFLGMENYDSRKATEQFGEKGRNGALVISIKEEINEHFIEGLKWRAAMQQFDSAPRMLRPSDINQNGEVGVSPKFYGVKTATGIVPVSHQFIWTLNPAWIAGAEIYTPQESLQKFGAVGKEGAIVVSIRKEKEAGALQSVR